jgi:hypothetical protein
LSHPSPFTAQEILNLYTINVPICWNYDKDEYPESFLDKMNRNIALLGDLTQEYVANIYDSDGVVFDPNASDANTSGLVGIMYQ